ncbi:MAG: hypothetical protein KatS3mg102_0227 [Planctomycetota bacterium]|nr:MAG: hypothetical protein KatS3mg102_0227 [Planctomycetota bacterium]
MELKRGDRISEYVLDERLGAGGFGVVWRAHHHVFTDRVVAIKVPANAEQARLLRHEGVLADLVRHPGAVEVLGLDPDHDPPYLVLEYVEGESLRERLRARGRLEADEAVGIGCEVLAVLAEAHRRGIVHRDLKPENVLLRRDGRVKLADFGLGRLRELEHGELLLSGAFVSEAAGGSSGTLAYMAPEQKQPGRPVDARADVYAFGLVLFEMLTGALPEGREVPSELVAGLDPALDRIFAGCYCRLEARYPDAGAVLRELQAVRARLGRSGAAPPGAGREARRGGTARLEPLEGGAPLLLGAGPAVLGSGREAGIRLRGRAVAARHAVIARQGGAWTIRDAGSAAGTWLLPAHVPQGKRPVDLIEKVGREPLELAEGVTICLGDPREPDGGVRLVFRDGEPLAAWSGGMAGEHDGSSPGQFRLRAGSVKAAVAGLVAFAVSLLFLLRFRVPLWAFLGAMVVGIGASALFSEHYRRRDEELEFAPAGGSPRLVPVRAAGVALRGLALAIDLALFLLVVHQWWAPFAWFAYDWLATGLWGATAGKWVLGLRVVDLEGRPIGLGRAFMRSVGKVLSTLPFGLGYAFAAITVSRQAFHDFLAETRVVR